MLGGGFPKPPSSQVGLKYFTILIMYRVKNIKSNFNKDPQNKILADIIYFNLFSLSTPIPIHVAFPLIRVF